MVSSPYSLIWNRRTLLDSAKRVYFLGDGILGLIIPSVESSGYSL
jgi:hypothetical protein